MLVAVDDFSRLTLLIMLPNLESKTVRDAVMDRIISVYGRPRRIRTDRGREFLGDFKEMLETLGIEHLLTRPISPWTNGRAERMVRTVKSSIKRIMSATRSTNWPEFLPWINAAINATICRSTGYSPHEIFFGEPPTPLLPPNDALPPIPFNLGEASVEDYVRAVKRRLAHLHAKAAAQQRLTAAASERDYSNTPIAGRQYAGESQFA